MPRIALQVSYQGTAYHGWQCQPQVVSVQATLEKVLSRLVTHPVKVCCAGRTDKGVHATGQIVHFDTEVERPERTWLLGANALLPADISIMQAAEVDQQFHARYSAVTRSYRYVIDNAKRRSPLHHQTVSWYHQTLAVESMQQAATYLVGQHDFSSFRAAECQAHSPVRTVYDLTLQHKPPYIILDVKANAFLQHMVRNIVGVLLAVGSGKQPPEWVVQVLQARDRRCAGITAAPQGLCLQSVEYPPPYESFSQGARFAPIFY